jgi:hypothetical protein
MTEALGTVSPDVVGGEDGTRGGLVGIDDGLQHEPLIRHVIREVVA